MSLMSYADPFWGMPIQPVANLRTSDMLSPWGARDLVGNRMFQGTSEDMRKLSNVLSADIIEGANDFHVQVDLPGIEMANLDVSINNGMLNIRAERKRMEERGGSFFGFGRTSERIYGVVQRSIAIPEGANVECADAKFENGVLTVIFPKKEGFSGMKKLTVKTPGNPNV